MADSGLCSDPHTYLKPYGKVLVINNGCPVILNPGLFQSISLLQQLSSQHVITSIENHTHE